MSSRILQKGKNRITQAFTSEHKGIDIGRSHITGEPIIAHSAGKVILLQTGQKNNKTAAGNASYGNFVKINHGNGYATLYAHLASVTVTSGEKVAQGQVIGTMGNTGRSFGMHLHFEVRKDNVRIDPTPYLEADLPKAKPEITYRAYARKWYAEIVGCNDINTKGYAGVKGKPMTAFMAKLSGGKVHYRVHQLHDNRWLNLITGYNTADSRQGYAGNKGKNIDAVQITISGVMGYSVKYRVSTVGGDWLPWCENGEAAGVYGEAIDRIQVKVVKT